MSVDVAILGGVPARISSSELIGRAAELDTLREALARTRTDGAQVILAGGEAGGGKSRLVGEFVSALPLDVRVLTGYCLELRQAVLPFAPLVGMLRQLGEQLGPGRTAELYGQELARFLPGAVHGGPVDDRAMGGAGALFGELYALLAALDEAGPLVLVIEDLHWADRSTLDLLSYLARELGSTRALVLATYRSDEMRRSHPLRPLLGELGRLPNVGRLDLEPLGTAEVGHLLAAITGGELPPRLVADIVDRAEGNPFFAEELLAASGDRGVPPTLRDILATRLESLPEQAREVLRIAAAAGRRVDHRLLSQVATLGPDQLDQGLRAAVEHGALVPDGQGYLFRHALLQEAAHEQLLPGERMRLHAAVADALTADPSLAAAGADSVDAELAHHALQAMDLDRAYPALVAAARRAADLFADPEAMQHLERALEIRPRLSPGVTTEPEWQLLALASELAAEPEAMVRYGERALALLDPDRDPETVGEQLAKLGWKYWIDGRLDAALDASERALRLLRPEPTAARAEALGNRSRFLMFASRYEEGTVVGTEAVAIARAVGADRQLSSALNSLGCSRGTIGDEAGLANLRECIEVGLRVGGTDEVIRGHNNLASVLVTPFNRVAEAEQVQRDGLAYAEQRRTFAGGTSFLRIEHANALIRLCRWDEADEELIGLPLLGGVLEQYYDSTRSVLLALRGRYAEAAELERKRGGVDVERDASQGAAPIAEARLRLQTVGHWSEPVPIEPMLRATHGDPVVFSVAAWRARAAVARTGPDRAQTARAEIDEVLDELRTARAAPRAVPVTITELDAWIAVVMAERSRLDGSEPALWTTAHQAVSGLVHAEWELYTQFRLVEALILTGAADRAADALLALHERSTPLGAALPGDLGDLARRARIKLPGTSVPPSVDLLTAREAEVLALVAEGLTNREIGRRLYISEKTASVHVSNVMAKLGASNRTEAVRLAADRGIALSTR
jgi:DNA-binding CsgD family transcriptional regulator/tetratricopeptide (TPR) repeat protein